MNYDEPFVPTPFSARYKPTVEQVKSVWDSMRRPSLRKVHARVVANGGIISVSKVQKWKTYNWNPPPHKKSGRKTKIELSKTPLHKEVDAKIEAKAASEVDALARDYAEIRALAAFELANATTLKARRDVEILIYEILYLCAGQRKSGSLAMQPRDVAALVQAFAYSSKPVATNPLIAAEAPYSNGAANGHTKHEPSTITKFRREHGLI